MRPWRRMISAIFARSLAFWVLAEVHVAKGDLERAERAAREALELMESCGFGWLS